MDDLNDISGERPGLDYSGFLKPSRSGIVGSLQNYRQIFSLDKGKAEAIALALKEKAQLLGIDDKNGINAGERSHGSRQL